MDLSHWDLVEEFSLYDAVSLAAGLDPHIRIVPVELQAKVNVLRKIMTQSYDNAIANAEFYLSGGFDETFDGKIDKAGDLISIELFEAVSHCIDTGCDLPKNFIMGDADLSITFERKTLAKWFLEKGYKPVYTWQRAQEQKQSVEPAISEKPESSRKTTNLLKAISSIASDAYGYVPGGGNSTAATDIANAMLNSRGFTLDAKTIRGYLKEGDELLDPPKQIESKK